MAEHDVKDLAQAAAGRLRIEWAEQSMPVLRLVRERFAKEQPLKGIRLGASLHVTTETAVLMLTLKAGGAQVVLCASNPLSTQDDTAAALVKEYGIPVFAHKAKDNTRYYGHLDAVPAWRPARRGWGRTSSSPRWSRCGRWKRSWTASRSCRWPTPPKSAKCS